MKAFISEERMAEIREKAELLMLNMAALYVQARDAKEFREDPMRAMQRIEAALEEALAAVPDSPIDGEEIEGLLSAAERDFKIGQAIDKNSSKKDLETKRGLPDIKTNSKQNIMGARITWTESSTTYYKYSAELTDEQAELFETDEQKFFEEVDFFANGSVEWEDVKDHDAEDFEVEYDDEE